MTIDIDHIDADQIERDDADRAIDAAKDAAAENTAIEHDAIVTDAMQTAEVLTVMSRGKFAVADMVRRMLDGIGMGYSTAERFEANIMLIDRETNDVQRADLCRQALRAASRPTRREIELHAKLNSLDALLNHYMREARSLREQINQKKVA